jgi:putative transposase
MAHPERNALPENILNPKRYFFATARTAMSHRLFQNERNAGLLIDVLRSLVSERKFRLHDFVIMPDHVHLLIELDADTTIEKTMQFVKGRFSRRIGLEFNYQGDVWQRGYSEEQVTTKDAMDRCRAYIAANPVKVGLAESADRYAFSFCYLAARKAMADTTQGLKPDNS